MAGMGPAPKPADQRRRRNATIATTKLPAAGRQGEAPKWPLHDDVVLIARRDSSRRLADELELQLLEPELTGRQRTTAQKKFDSASMAANIADRQLTAQREYEGELWAELWATPQAAAWERLRWTREVAQYTRWKVKAEGGDLDASKESRQLGDRLGLTSLAMRRLGWEVAEDEVAEQRRTATGRAAQTPRRRLKVVDPGVAGA